MSNQLIRIGFVDDHQIVLQGLRLLVQHASDIECVFVASSSAEALAALDEETIDVVLLDIALPDMDGIEFCKLVKTRFPMMRVIALTMHNERSLIQGMIEAGADGYLLKNTGQEELLSSIRRVFSGKSHFTAEITEVLVRGNPSRKVGRAMIPSLSGREKQIVRLIMQECTSAEIAEKLHISFHTVETHRRNIMHKLNAKNAAGIVRFVMEHGLLDDGG